MKVNLLRCAAIGLALCASLARADDAAVYKERWDAFL